MTGGATRPVEVTAGVGVPGGWIGREAGVKFIDTLRDDDLPGDLDDPRHTYVGMMKENVETMARVLGGDASALKGIDPANLGSVPVERSK